MDLRVAVGLRGRGEQEPRPLLLGQAQGVQRPDGAHLERLDRKHEVVDRRGGAGEVQDLVDRTGNVHELRHVGLEQMKARPAQQVLDVARCSGDEVVERDHLAPVVEQALAQVGAQEPRSSGDDDSRHADS
jgi:hypothetical protein